MRSEGLWVDNRVLPRYDLAKVMELLLYRTIKINIYSYVIYFACGSCEKFCIRIVIID